MIVGSLLLILVAVGLLVAGVLSGSNVLIVCSIVVVALAAIVLVLGVRQSAAAADAYDDEDENDGRDEPTGEYPAVSDSGFPVRQSDRRHEAARDRFAAASEDDGVAPIVVTSRRADRTGGGVATALEAGTVVLSTTTADHGQMVVDEQTGRGIPSQGADRERYGYDTPAYETPSYQTPSYETEAISAVQVDDPEIDLDEDPPDEPAAQMVTAAAAARVAMLTTDVLVVDGRPRYHVAGCAHLLSRETEPLPVGEAVELGFTPCGLCEPDSALLADARRV